jgi:pilus assembly protein CpaF
VYEHVINPDKLRNLNVQISYFDHVAAETSDMSFDIIQPFLRPITPLILDPTVSEGMVNPSGRVFVERTGVLEEVSGAAVEERNLRWREEHRPGRSAMTSRRSARSSTRACRMARGWPRSFRPAGSAARRSPSAGSRRGSSQPRNSCAAARCRPRSSSGSGPAIARRHNILISDGTSTGKPTVHNALAAFLPAAGRVVVIEDTAEMQIARDNVLRFQARREQPDLAAVTIRDLLRATLRHRPDRVVLGEVRGGEAFNLLQVLNTGMRERCPRSTRTGPRRRSRAWRPAWSRAESTSHTKPSVSRSGTRFSSCFTCSA